MIDYFANIPKNKAILWCYLIWYMVVVFFYFDPDIRIWLNSIGISIVIGFALVLSVTSQNGSKLDGWQVFRLFAMPFCVSSYSSLIKGQGFIFVIPPNQIEQIALAASCVAFITFVFAVKKACNKSNA